MKCGSRLERCASALLIIGAGVLASGTKACREDYDFASQSNVPRASGTPVDSITPSATATPTTTPTGSITVTGTITPEQSGSPTVAPTLTEEADDGEDTQGASGGGDLFNELSALSEGKSAGRATGTGPSAGGAGGAGSAGNSAGRGGNWLGAAFSKESDTSWRDGDGDGFNDAFEEEHESDPRNSASTPRLESTTRLDERIRREQVEQEADRLGDESRFADGDEVEVDSDIDGIPDHIEEERGMDPKAMDSDQDGLRDDRELVLGTNPLRVDSDSDGISDAREYAAGSDPTIPEPK